MNPDFRLSRRRHLRLGRAGENAASRLLREKRYEILVRDWRCPFGEIDLVARDGLTLVFVEVKTRRAGGAGRPAEALRRRQRERIVNASRHYLRRIDRPAVPVRYDLVEVVISSWGLVELRHWPDHFQAGSRRYEH